MRGPALGNGGHGMLAYHTRKVLWLLLPRDLILTSQAYWQSVVCAPSAKADWVVVVREQQECAARTEDAPSCLILYDEGFQGLW